MKRSVAVLLALCLLCGCATLGSIADDDRAQYLAAQKTFTAMVSALADLRAAGTFTEAQADRLTEGISAGKDILLLWSTALLADEDSTDFRGRMNDVLMYLDRHGKAVQDGA